MCNKPNLIVKFKGINYFKCVKIYSYITQYLTDQEILGHERTLMNSKHVKFNTESCDS